MNFRPNIPNPDIIGQILQEAIAIQNEGLATVFVSFSGHTGDMDIQIHAPMWDYNQEPTYKIHGYVDRRNMGEIILKDLREAREKLLNPQPAEL